MMTSLGGAATQRIVPLLGLVLVVTLACLLPFVNKAFHIDDPLFIWAAQHIRGDASDFYGFDVNWYGWGMQLADVAKNPPGVSYYLALVGMLCGWSEIALHTALLLPAVAVAWGTFRLARELHAPPAWASLSTVLTPGFMVSSSNVMSDTSMLALWLWAMLCWVHGVRNERKLALLASAILVALAALTKYFAVALIPLLFTYTLCERRRLGSWVWYLLIPVVVLAAYQWLTFTLYGRGLLFDAAAYATQHRTGAHRTPLAEAVIGLAFAGGTALPVLFHLPFLWSRRWLTALAAASALVVVGGARVGFPGALPPLAAGGLLWSYLVQCGLLLAGGMALLALAIADLHRHRDAAAILLALWVVGTLVFASFVNWTINVRSVLPVIPAAGILLARRVLPRAPAAAATGQVWRRVVALAAAAIVSLLVSAADFVWANTARQAAAEIDGKVGGRGGETWFQGHWGFQYYMQRHGHRAVDWKQPQLQRGDLLVIPSNNTNVRAPPAGAAAEQVIETRPLPWLATMNASLGAGFYADAWGALPFVFGPVQRETYTLLHVP